MKQHLTTEQCCAYAQRRLSPAELLAVDAHLAECAACRQQLETALPASAFALHAALQPEARHAAHLSFEQLAAYVEDTLNYAEVQTVRDHLATCWQCAHETEDLRKFVATESVPRPVIETRTSWWERVREWLTVPALGWAAAALAFVIVGGWLLPRLWQRPADAPQVAQQDATPTPLPVLSPTPGALWLAQITDGNHRVTLDQQGTLSGLEALPPAQQQLIKNVLVAQRLERPAALSDLQRRGSSLMGPSSNPTGNKDDEGHRFVLQAPVGKVVSSERPTFKWSPLAGATSYAVEVYDEQFNLIAQSEALTQTQWTPPRSLARGKVFAWQVKALKDGQTITAPAPPAPQARFRIITAAQLETIGQAKRAGSPLSLAVLYTQAGLLDEAETELRILRQTNPDSALIRRWQAQVRAMRR